MPKYLVTSPQGQTLEIEGDTPPTEKELDDIFARMAPADKPAPVAKEKSVVERLNTGYADLVSPNDQAEARKKMSAVGARGALPALGQAAGGATGPFAPIAVPVLGALGGAAGEIVGSALEGTVPTGGQIAGAAVEGAIPGSPLAGKGGKAVAREAGKLALGGAGAKLAEGFVDDRLPSLGEIAIAAGSDAVGAPISRLFASAVPTPELESALRKRTAAFDAVRKEGAVLPPDMLLKGDADLLSTIGGQTAIAREASLRNIPVWQKMARRSLGLPVNELPISVVEDLKPLRAKAGEVYKEISSSQKEAIEKLAEIRRQHSDPQDLAAALGTPEAQKLAIQAGADVDALKVLRENAQNAAEAMRAGDPQAYAVWKQNREAADALEDRIEEAAVSLGKTGIVDRLREARKLIAKTYAVENAIPVGRNSNGLVDPASLGAQLENRVPLEGDLEKIANFANNFDRAAVDASALRGPNVRTVSGLSATAQASRGDLPGFLGAAATMVGGPFARPILLSDFIQKRIVSPQERANLASQLARFLAQQQAEAFAQAEEFSASRR